MILLRRVTLAAVGISSLWFNFHLALRLEEAYATACAGRSCLSIANEMYLLKVSMVITALCIPLALAWVIEWRNDGDLTN